MLTEPSFVHMVQWFEKCRKLWIQCCPQWDEPLFNLSEDFFDVIMVSHYLADKTTERNKITVTCFHTYPEFERPCPVLQVVHASCPEGTHVDLIHAQYVGFVLH